MKKTLLGFLALLCTASGVRAQTNIGIGTTTPNAGAQLDVTAANRGLLPPRVALTANNVWTLAGSPTDGMMVFNTTATGSGTTAVVAGMYIWFNSQWNQITFQSGVAPATFTAATLSCTGTLSGTYTQGTTMTTANNKTITITTATAGSYNASTNTANGVTFAASGTLLSTGTTNIVLTASGTPATIGTFTYTVAVAGQTCTFTVTYAAGATFACGSITNTLPAGLINGQSYTGTVTSPYTAGGGGTYPSSSTTVNGLTLTSVAGTYAAGGGNVTYNLSGTFTGTSGTSVTFTLPESGCTVSAGNAIFAASSLNCGGALSGTYQVGVATTSANTKVVSINVTTAGGYSATTGAAVNGVTFAASGAITTGTQNVTLVASGTPTTSGTFTYTVALGGQTCTFSVTYLPVATFNCAGATQTQSPVGVLNAGAYTGTYVVNYTAGNGQTYPAYTQTISGLTLTAPSGTYAAGGGSITYTLTGTYSGAANGTVSFPGTVCGIVVYGDALRGALANAGCASCAAYDAAATNTWVTITAAEYNAVATTTNVAGVTKSGASDAFVAAPPSYNWGNTITVGPLQSTTVNFWNVPVTNNYVVAYKVTMDGAGNGLQFKVGATYTNGFVAYGSTTACVSGVNYYVMKRPSTSAGSNPYIAMYNGSGPGSMGCGNGGNGTVTFASGNVGTLTFNSSGEPALQAVSTPTKQW